LAYNGLNQLVGVGFPVLVQLYIVQVLSLELIGVLSLITSFWRLTQSSGNFLNVYLLKKIAKAEDKDFGDILPNSVLSYLLAMGFPFLFTLVYLFSQFPDYWGIISLSAVPMFTFAFAMEYYFLGQMKNAFIFKRRAILKTVSVLMILLFVKSDEDFTIYAAVVFLSVSLEHLWNFIRARNYLELKNVKKNVVVKNFTESSKYFVFSLTHNYLPHLFLIVMSYFLSLEVIGVLAIVVKLLNLATTFVSSSVMVFFPKMIKSGKDGPGKGRKDLYLRFTILASLLVVGGLIVFKSLVLNLFLNGQSYDNLHVDFIIMSSYVCFQSVYNYLAYNRFVSRNFLLEVSSLNVLILLLFPVFYALLTVCGFAQFSMALSFVLPVLLVMLIGFYFVSSRNSEVTC
jgi:O-antigen/teichoic acid export membrane protein